MRIHAPHLMLTLALTLGGLAGLAFAANAPAKPALPRLLELGSVDCIPCKKMAPIIEELKHEYAGKLTIEFIDVWKVPAAANEYGIAVIPTQIFFDATGKERFRHTGFFAKEDILAKFQELGTGLGTLASPAFSRWEPAQRDTRAKAAICYLCDGDISAPGRVTVATEKGDVHLCSMHHLLVMLSCLTTGAEATEAAATVADRASGAIVPVQSAVYLYSLDEATGRPTIGAFADRAAALAQRATAGGSLLSYGALRGKELAARCGFCDRAVYPEDAALVKAGGIQTWGCCSHCALGVAARTGLDIEVHERDRLTGEPVVVKTLHGSVVSVEPPTAVAWFGQRTKPDGAHASAGCFHQGFFVSLENLRKWVEANPLETGEMITIGKALADKMALSPQQIQKACKIGECAPK
jgi:thioredoxin 1